MALRYYVTRRVKKLDAGVPVIEHLLAAMKAQSAGKLEYAIIDVKDEETARQAKEDGLIMTAVGSAGPDTEVSLDQGYSGIVVRYGRSRSGS